MAGDSCSFESAKNIANLLEENEVTEAQHAIAECLRTAWFDGDLGSFMTNIKEEREKLGPTGADLEIIFDNKGMLDGFTIK